MSPQPPNHNFSEDSLYFALALQSALAKLEWGRFDPKAKEAEAEVRRRLRENRDEVVAEVSRKYGLKDD